MRHYNIIIKKRSDKETSRNFKPLSKLQLIKFGVVALLVLSAVIGFFLTTFIIGLLLVLPLAILGILWFIYMVWRGKIKIR